MAERYRMIFGDTSDLMFESPPFRAEKGMLHTISYSNDGKSIPTRRIREMDGSPVLEWPPILPDYDPRGNRSVSNGYVPGKNAKASRKGLPGYFFSHKAGGKVPHHSDLEKRLLTALELCPYVVEIRAQYPEWDEDHLAEIAQQGRRIARNKIMTIDIMVTLKFPGCPDVIYHAIAGKPYALVGKQGNQARHTRERNEVDGWGTTHEVMTELTISQMEHSNNLLLLAYMRNVEDIKELSESAKALADALNRTRVRGTLDRVIEVVSRRFGWDVNTGYRIFAVAHFLGHLAWNHDFKLGPDKPMKLKSALT